MLLQDRIVLGSGGTQGVGAGIARAAAAPYVATKAGLVGLTRNAAHAHRWDRIRVNGINIGWTQTPGEDAVQRGAHGAEDGWAEHAAKELPMGRLA